MCLVSVFTFWLFSYLVSFVEKNALEKVVFINPDSSQASFYLEVADDNAERAKGLMFRKAGDLADDQGMIFIFPDEKNQTFWMKNTYISLDIIFIGSDLEVKGILQNVPTLSTESRSINKASKFVVELLAGTAKQNGIKQGSKLSADFLRSYS